MTTKYQLDTLKERLAQPLAGHFAQMRMSPEDRQQRVEEALASKTPRHAAVLVLLFQQDEMLHLVLTVRRKDLRDHAGQVSFVGGRIEEGEAPETAALREAEEEIGIEASQIEILGALTPLYIPPSNFMVHPFVGFYPQKTTYNLQTSEVAEVLEIPLSHFLNPENEHTEIWQRFGKELSVPFYLFDTHKIWGATAMMLAEFCTLWD